MSEPFLGQIRIFAGNFAPRGHAFCEGQLLPISQNQALFSLLGTVYGGDGRTTFALPDLRGRLAIHEGNGPGLSNRPLGSRGGSNSVTMTQSTMPSHSHPIPVSDADGETDDPDGQHLAKSAESNYAALGTQLADYGGALTNTGGNHSIPNMQPSLGLNYIIAIVGVYPSRS